MTEKRVRVKLEGPPGCGKSTAMEIIKVSLEIAYGIECKVVGDHELEMPATLPLNTSQGGTK